MSKFIPARLLTTLVLTIIALVGPWWLGILVFVFSVWFFRYYYEAVIPAMIFDVLYGFPLATPLRFQFVATVFVVVVVALGDELRGHFV